MIRDESSAPLWTILLGSLVVFGLAAFVFSQYGFQGELSRDTANLLYSAQQMAQGVPPYVSIFNHSGPLAPLLAGIAVSASDLFNTDSIMAVRAAFFILGALGVVAVYLLGSSLFQSQQAGMLAASIFVGYECFCHDAVSGPRTKIPMVLFEALALFLASKRSWFWAGFCASLAGLAWQPAALYALTVVVLAFAQSKDRRDRKRNTLNAAAGAIIPVLGVSGYFAYKRALGAFIEGAVLFNLKHLDRQPGSFFEHIAAAIGVVFRGYPLTAIPIFIGMFAILVIYVWRFKANNGGAGRLLSMDRFAAVLITFPLLGVLSLTDFQGCPDLFVFLPYTAIGFGWLLHLALRSMSMTVGPVGHRVVFVLLCATLLGTAVAYHRITRERGLVEQRRLAQEIESEFGRDCPIISIGAPELLVLLERTNPNPYVFIASGIDKRIDATTPGGFEGWLQQLAEHDPCVIAVGGVARQDPAVRALSGRFKNALIDWLQADFEERPLGRWTLFVKRSRTSN
jgi:hypothetical protein